MRSCQWGGRQTWSAAEGETVVRLVGSCLAKGVRQRSAEEPFVDRGHDSPRSACARASERAVVVTGFGGK